MGWNKKLSGSKFYECCSISIKEEWKLDIISQVTERTILAFFKNDLD